MAPRATTFTVNWNANYNGPHRVCWRIVGEPSYNCTADGFHPNCGLGPCSYDVPVTVDDETCTPVNYEGYVQPACLAEGDLSQRIPFVVSFVPDQRCNRYQAICQSSPVGSITLTDGGNGYTPGAPPNVILSGGGGTGATATAVVGGGIIQTIGIGVAGAGYTDGVYVAVPLLAGSGAGATADITISGGTITVVTLNNPGTGYQDSDILVPDPGVVGVPGTEAELTITTDYGIIIDIILDTAGTGYTSAPTVTVDASPSVTATATSALRGCDALTITDCNGATIYEVAEGTLQPGEDYFMCGETEPTVPSDFSVVENGNCLCNCTSYTVENTGAGPDTIDVFWIDCDGSAQTANLAAGGGPTAIACAVTDSITHVLNGPTATFTLVAGAACDAVAP